jgi:hypothetical protein
LVDSEEVNQLFPPKPYYFVPPVMGINKQHRLFPPFAGLQCLLWIYTWGTTTRTMTTRTIIYTPNNTILYNNISYVSTTPPFGWLQLRLTGFCLIFFPRGYQRSTCLCDSCTDRRSTDQVMGTYHVW